MESVVIGAFLYIVGGVEMGIVQQVAVTGRFAGSLRESGQAEKITYNCQAK